MTAYEKVLAMVSEEDPALRELLDAMIEDVAGQLGESPEAWRGCEVVCDQLVVLFKQAEKDKPIGPLRAVGLITFVSALTMALGLHPMTPWAKAHPGV